MPLLLFLMHKHKSQLVTNKPVEVQFQELLLFSSLTSN